MTDKDFYKMWHNWLIDINMTETKLSKELGTSQQNLNKKIRKGSIRYIDLANIVEKYGYQINISKNK